MTTNYTVSICNRFDGLASDEESSLSKITVQKKNLVDSNAHKKTDQVQKVSKSYTKKPKDLSINTQRDTGLAKTPGDQNDDSEPYDENTTSRGEQRRQKQRTTRVDPNSIKTKRLYDRRSGTGRGREIKRQGGGSHNWGKDEDNSNTVEAQQNDSDHNVDEVHVDNNANNTIRKKPMNYTDYKKSVRAKREDLLHHEKEENSKITFNDHQVPLDNLEKAGLQKYEKSDTHENTGVHKSNRSKHYYSNIHDDETTQRQQKFNISEFAGAIGSNRSRGNRARGQAYKDNTVSANEKDVSTIMNQTECAPDLDFNDNSAFPTLA